MNNFRIVVMTMCLLGFLTTGSAQDLHFSQFNRTPLLINPAQAGNFDGKVRAAAGYRNQWSQLLGGDGYNAYFISIDSRIVERKSGVFSLGLTGFTDVAGELRYGSKQLNISAAYLLKVGGSGEQHHGISMGMEFGVAERSVDLSETRWPSQQDGNGGWDPTIEVELPEGFNSDFNNADINFGIRWQSIFGRRKSVFLGFAGHHLNRPAVSFFTLSSETMDVRTTIHGGGEASFGQTWSLMPMFMYFTQGNNTLMTLGASVRKYFDKDDAYTRSVQLGIFPRYGKNLEGSFDSNAIVVMTNVNLMRINLGLSVDITTSDLSVASGFNGAWEFTAGYVFGSIGAEGVRNPVW